MNARTFRPASGLACISSAPQGLGHSQGSAPLPGAMPQDGGLPWPRVSLHLPVQDAPAALVRQTLDSLSALDYPALEVLVVDTSTTPAAWEPVAEHCARLGPRFRFFHLGCRVGEQAAALNFALRETAPDALLVGTLEAGCLVHPGWLLRAVPPLLRPGVGFTQAAMAQPQPGDAPFSRFAAERPAREASPAVALRRSMGLIRLEALRLAGGWAEAAPDQHAELGLRLQRDGWEGMQLPEPLGTPPALADAAAWRERQVLVARSALDLLRRHGDVLLRPSHPGLSPAQRRQVLLGLLPVAVDLLWLSTAALALAFTLMLAPLRDAAILPAVPLALAAILLVGGRGLVALVRARPGARWLALAGAWAAMPLRGATLWCSLLGRAPRKGGKVAMLPALMLGASAGSLAMAGAAALPWALAVLLLGLPAFAALLPSLLARTASPMAGRAPTSRGAAQRRG